MNKQEKQRVYYENNKEHILQKAKIYRDANIDIKEKKRIIYEKNKEQILQQQRLYYEENRELIQERRRIYTENNKEHIQERQRRYNKNNKEHIQEQTKQYNEKNKEHIQEQTRLYNEKNREYIQERAKIYNEKNKEQLQGQRIIYSEKNKEYIQDKQKLYYTANKEKLLERKPRCKSIWCNTHINKKKNEGYCLRCFIHTYPDKPVAKNYKTKEKTVVDYVLQKYTNFTWYSDKKITDGCSRRRPDLLADFGYFVMIIEIDENQHNDYDTTCENKRLMELSQDVGHRPIVFIRFNPDEYIIDNNKITSCWGINGDGICVVKKTKINEWNCRLIKLEEQIDFWCNPVNKTEKTIEQIHLFYDVNLNANASG